MPLEPLFSGFRPGIEACFARAVADAELSSATIDLLMSDDPYGRQTSRAQFLVIAAKDQVRITWNGIASLWALCQSVSRVTKRIYEARRADKQELSLEDDPELEKGLKSFELARRLLDGDVPPDVAERGIWPKWAPPIEPDPADGTDDHVGVIFFFGALSWILRHELAHITLNHDERQASFEIDSIQCEREADKQATIWVKGDHKADVDRVLGSKPSASDLNLDGQALKVGLALIWVALFDSEQVRQSAGYPPVAERIGACWNVLDLSLDSAASEIIADLIGCWLNPDTRFGPTKGFETASDAMYDALHRLHIHISSLHGRYI